MRVEKFVADKKQRLSEALQSKFSVPYNFVQKLFREKDIKVNGVRVSKEMTLSVGDEVVFFVPDDIGKLSVVFEDENIIVVFKRRQIETVSLTSGDDLLSKVSSLVGHKCYAVHRLDRNTEGLVIFSKNIKSKECLDSAFKERTIEKYYLALVYGFVQSGTYHAYLRKDSKLSLVYISDDEKPHSEKITTKVKVLSANGETALVEVELVTGKTHQIRAHLAHIGSFVIGDEKYGNSKINKEFKKKFQCLCAYKLIFHFKKGDTLEYLNNKTIILDKSKIDFCKNL